MSGKLKGFLQRVLEFWIQVIDAFFHPKSDPLSFWVERIWSAGLYLGGGVVWSFFLNFGGLSFDVHDWTQEGPRYYFLRQALLEKRLPLYIGSELVSTDHFLAIPDIVISPQVLLLRFVEPGLFVLINTLLLYSLGYLGLHLLRRKFRWSPISFTIVFLLFILNGHPVAHVAVGHSMWVSYFLLPFFVLLILKLIEGQMGWLWITQMALLQLGLFLQGGFHFVIWNLMFLVLLGIFSPRYLLPILKAVLFSMLISLVRILPSAIEFSGKENLFISGYFSLTDMFQAFTTLKAPAEALSGMYSTLGWWEVDIYTGLLGLAFLAFFGLYLTWKSSDPDMKSQRNLLAPIFAMSVLSIGKIYQPINMLPIPLMDAERVSARFLIIPAFVTLILAGMQLEKNLQWKRLSFGTQLISLTLVGVMGHDLLQHTRLWRVENMTTLFTRAQVDIRTQILLRVDPLYEISLLLGLGISILTLVFLIYKTYQKKRKLS